MNRKSVISTGYVIMLVGGVAVSVVWSLLRQAELAGVLPSRVINNALLAGGIAGTAALAAAIPLRKVLPVIEQWSKEKRHCRVVLLGHVVAGGPVLAGWGVLALLRVLGIFTWPGQ